MLDFQIILDVSKRLTEYVQFFEMLLMYLYWQDSYLD